MADSSSSEESSDEDEYDEASPSSPVVSMAEPSSSEESSDENEHDQASPSLSDPVSPTTAARHPNRKKLRYVRDYLQRLPKHQRRRIKKEIKRGQKPGETDVYKLSRLCTH